MSIALADAYRTAKSVSLHCTKGRSDKLYDLQLVPKETASGVMWEVLAQNGRRGAKMVPRVKCKPTSRSAANTIYESVLSEKLGEDYRHVPVARKSDLTAAIAAAAGSSAFPGVRRIRRLFAADDGLFEHTHAK